MFPRQHKTAFDNDDLKALQRVFDAACAVLLLGHEDRTLRERLAQFVFEMAQMGERNEMVLWNRAVRRFGNFAGSPSGRVRRAEPLIFARRSDSHPSSRV